MPDLLIAGGGRDPNLPWLRAAAERIGASCQSLLVDDDNVPAFSWELGGSASVAGVALDCRAAFIRYDVFSQLYRSNPATAAMAGSWFSAITAYCMANAIFAFNQSIDPMSASKPAMLILAAQCGFGIPATLLSNSQQDIARFTHAAPHIAKPVNGGSYAMGLDQAITDATWDDGMSPTPAIVQPMLAYPERRIYRAGDAYFAFDIASTTLDSRLDKDMVISAFPLENLPSGIVDKLRALTDRLRCDFCAIDMKTDPATGELIFLELNNGPMIKAYDVAAGGTMAEAMVRYLIGRGTT